MDKFRVYYGKNYPDFYWDCEATNENEAEEKFLNMNDDDSGYIKAERIDE